MPIQIGILPAGSTLTVDYSIGETATISYQDGDIGVVDNGQTKTTDRTIGPFANDVAYSIDYTGCPKVFTTAAGGAITTISLPLPDPASLPVRVPVVVGGVPAISNGVAMRGFAVNETALRNIHCRVNNPSVATANYEDPSGVTHGISMQMKSKFNAFRILLCNGKTNASATYGPACATVQSKVTSIEEARNNSATPVQITWGGSSTVTIPAATSNSTPQYVWSDWISLDSIQPVDGSGCPWISVRVFNPYDATFHSLTPNDSDLWRTTIGGGRWTYSGYGDFTGASYASFTGNYSTTNQKTSVIAIQGTSIQSCFSVYGYGDSVMQSTSGVTQAGKGMMYDAMSYLSGLFGIPVTIANFGWTAQNTTQYYTRLMGDISNLNASAIIYESLSTNDGAPTVAIIASAKLRLMAVINKCRELGVIPIIWTPRVNNAWTLQQKQLINAFYNEIKSITGLVIFDEYAAIVDSSTLSIKPEYSSDGVHPNQFATDSVLTAALVKALKQALYGSQLIALP